MEDTVTEHGHTLQPDECHVIVIGGAARSGTTLMQAILCSDEATNPVLSEAAPLKILVDAYRKTLTHVNAYPDMYFTSKDEVKYLFREHVQTFMAHFLRKYNCQYCVWKMPTLTPELPILASLIPNFQMICMVRDPRDIVTSMIQVADKKRTHDDKHPWVDFSVEDFARICLSYYERLLSMKLNEYFKGQISFIRYEDLVNNTEEILNEIRAFTGLRLADFDRDSRWSSVKINLDQETSPARDFITSLYGGPVNKSRIGSWRQRLNHSQASVVEEICQPIMDRFSYHND